MNENISTHYEALKQLDLMAWKNFNAELAKEEYLDKFRRTILKNSKLQLIDLPSWVRTCMVKHMAWWSHEAFDTNTWPEIPALVEQ